MSAWYPLWLYPWPFSLKYSNSVAEGCVAPVEVQPNRHSVSQGQQVSLRVKGRHFRLKKKLWTNLQVETINTGTGTRKPGTQETNVLRAGVAPVDTICKKLKFLWGKWEAFPQAPLATAFFGYDVSPPVQKSSYTLLCYYFFLSPLGMYLWSTFNHVY